MTTRWSELKNYGKKVRKTIEEPGGDMPEDLPVADSIKKIEPTKETKGVN